MVRFGQRSMPQSGSRGLPDAVEGTVSTRCPSCAESDTRRIGELPAVKIFAGQVTDSTLPASSLFACRACGLLFRYPVLSRSQYDALYGKVPPTTWPDQPGRIDWALIAEFVGRNSIAGASTLDFGCHTGGLLKRLGSRYSLYGVEVNKTAVQIAREKTGAEIVEGLEALPRGKQFDFVTAVDVVEHFSDPGRAIASLLEVVKPGGSLVITTGDADAWLWRIAGSRWWYCYYPEHLAFISERWMRDWLKRNGMLAHVAEARRFRHLYLSPLHYVRQACLLSAYLSSPRAYTWVMRRIKRILRRQGDVDPPGIGLTKDHVFLAIRKQP
jgi:SAM-dependent methyltransferase